MKYKKPLIDNFIHAIEIGHGRVKACEIVGIHYDTFRDWEKNKPEFSERLKKAEDLKLTTIEETSISNIMNAANSGIWQASAWLLERLFPNKYGKRDRIDHTTAGERITQFKIEVIDNDHADVIKKIINEAD